jgi:hypothetical protein
MLPAGGPARPFRLKVGIGQADVRPDGPAARGGPASGGNDAGMDCADAKLRMEPYATGNLASPDREEFEKHVSDCEGCRLELDLTRAGFGVNRLDEPPPAPEPPPAGDFIRSGDAGFSAGAAFGASSGVDETSFADVASELTQEFSPSDIEHTASPVPSDSAPPAEPEAEAPPIQVERARPVAEPAPPPPAETTPPAADAPPPPAAAGSRSAGGPASGSRAPDAAPGAGNYSLDALLANAAPSAPSGSESPAEALARAIPGGAHASPGSRKGWEFEPAESGGSPPPPERSLFFAEEALARARDAGARRKGGAVKFAVWVAGAGVGVALLAVAIWIAFRPRPAEDVARMAAGRSLARPAEPAAPPSTSTPTPATGVTPSGGETGSAPTASAPGQVAAETEGGGVSSAPPAESAPSPTSASAPSPSTASPAPAPREVVSASATSQPSVLPEATRPVPPPEPPKAATPRARSTRARVAIGHESVSRAPRSTASTAHALGSKAVTTPPHLSAAASAPSGVKSAPQPAPPPAEPAPAAPAPGSRTQEPAGFSPPAAPATQEPPATAPTPAAHAAPTPESHAAAPPPAAGTGAAPSTPKPGAEALAPPTRPIDRLHLATLAAEQRGDLDALRSMRDTWKEFMSRSGVGPDRIRAKRELADCLWAIQALTGKKSDQQDALRAYRDYLLNAPAGGADSRSISRTKQLQDALSGY